MGKHVNHLPPHLTQSESFTDAVPSGRCLFQRGFSDCHFSKCPYSSLRPPAPQGFRNPSIKIPMFPEPPECARMSDCGPELVFLSQHSMVSAYFLMPSLTAKGVAHTGFSGLLARVARVRGLLHGRSFFQVSHSRTVVAGSDS